MAHKVPFIVAELGTDVDPFMLHSRARPLFEWISQDGHGYILEGALSNLPGQQNASPSRFRYVSRKALKIALIGIEPPICVI
ncbi:MAG: hypothetical protein WB760_33020 [Xanthobacteraceae bacterium]